MRLIDADILLGYVNKYDTGQPIGKALRAMLEKSPTVDAVPVDFIKKYQNTCNDDGKMTITDMLATWDILRKTWKSKGKV